MNGLRLGVSSDILPYSTEQVLEADYRLSKFVLSTVELAGKGLLLGGALSLFFLRKTPVIFYGAGFGAGLSVFHELSK
jgi:hypothetical protein